MSLALILWALLLAAPSGPDAAALAFARGEYAQAEQLATRAAASADPGANLYLAGLARFRSGDAQGALLLLEKAWDANDRPPEGPFRFNRASCLYELGRFDDAERDYVQAAALDESLRAVALIDAAFAALDAGATERARALAERARALASGPAKPLFDDLEQHLSAASHAASAHEYLAGLAAFDAGSFAEARAKFLAASAQDPLDGRSRIMSGASALHLGDRESARGDFTLSLTLRLDPADAQIARDYLESMAPGMAARGLGWEGIARVSAGYDSNALQAGGDAQPGQGLDSPARPQPGSAAPNDFPDASATSSPSAFATAEAGLTFRSRPRARLTAELSYAFSQLVYVAPDARDRSLQQHTLLASLELGARDDLRFGISLGAQLAFTGLDDFRGLQLNGLGALWTALDEGERATTRLELGFEPKAGLGEFSYLSGQRFDAALSQEVRLATAALTLGYRFRAELLGIAEEDIPPPPIGMPAPPPPCATGCTLIDPFGYTSSTLWLAGHAALGTRWSFDATAGVEWRDYTDDNALLVANPDGGQSQVDRRRRHDTRWFAGVGASLWLRQDLALTLRYDLVLNRSDIDREYAGEVRSYDKHVVSLGCALSW